MATSHVPAGVLAGLGYAAVARIHGPDAAVAAAVAGICSTLPDLDQAGWWRSMDRWLPDEWLGAGGPLQHRGITHWWLWPVLGWLLVLPQAAGWAHLLLAAAFVGVGSHLVGDWVVGRGGYGRGPGIPLGPWNWHFGVGIDCGGRAESLVIRPALLLAVPVAVYVVVFGGSL